MRDVEKSPAASAVSRAAEEKKDTEKGPAKATKAALAVGEERDIEESPAGKANAAAAVSIAAEEEKAGEKDKQDPGEGTSGWKPNIDGAGPKRSSGDEEADGERRQNAGRREGKGKIDGGNNGERKRDDEKKERGERAAEGGREKDEDEVEYLVERTLQVNVEAKLEHQHTNSSLWKLQGYAAAYLASLYGHRLGVFINMTDLEVSEAVHGDKDDYLLNMTHHKKRAQEEEEAEEAGMKKRTPRVTRSHADLNKRRCRIMLSPLKRTSPCKRPQHLRPRRSRKGTPRKRFP
ncbi:uncharacterized protein LOC117560179 [Gymnodraco acuticeps]|uniref:Uncharacterized protein LOC117560179 n=1 Tax=Gymnodraco acuticeps TaxID=8218 RepID=A0A6P8WYY3_GYMAC|nr:uncharacterized protein LOC117560179 [Gymnodraco acuticeps]